MPDRSESDPPGPPVRAVTYRHRCLKTRIVDASGGSHSAGCGRCWAAAAAARRAARESVECGSTAVQLVVDRLPVHQSGPVITSTVRAGAKQDCPVRPVTANDGVSAVPLGGWTFALTSGSRADVLAHQASIPIRFDDLSPLKRSSICPSDPIQPRLSDPHTSPARRLPCVQA
jgi:hypothetical protein